MKQYLLDLINKTSNILKFIAQEFQIIYSANLLKWRTALEKHPYANLMRMHKPAPYILMATPIWLTIIMRAPTNKIIFTLLFFTSGVILMRSIGCIINDIIDQNLDIQVSRTKERPIAAGTISTSKAITLLLILSFFAISLLFVLPPKVYYFGISIPIFIMLYPLSKRFTHYPQVVLGLTFNLGIWLTWFSIFDKFSNFPLLMYIGAAMWTVGYDTVYALQDIEDDKKTGMGSLTIRFAHKIPTLVWECYRGASISFAVAGINANMGILYYIFLAAATYQLWLQIEELKFIDSTTKELPISVGNNPMGKSVNFAILTIIGGILGRFVY